jgi:hypothetical protein
MKGTALNQIPGKIFAIFAIFVGEDLVADPDIITAAISGLPGDPGNVHVLPWYGDPFTVDYCDEADMRRKVEALNTVVATVEQCDPWVKSVFGVEGTGEGLVYFPLAIRIEAFKNFAFKVKGEKHRVVKAKEAIQVAPEVASNISDFVTMFVTEARLEQGLANVGGIALMPKMKDFLQWMMKDIVKESVVELEAAKLTMAEVQKATTTACREWFIKKSRTI